MIKVTDIIAFKEKIAFVIASASPDLASGLEFAEVRAFVPLINGTEDVPEKKYPGRPVFFRRLEKNEILPGSGGTIRFSIPRNSGFELLVCRFEITFYSRYPRAGSETGEGPAAAFTASGVKYVNGFGDDFSASRKKGPEIGKPLGTWMIAPDEDIDYMNFGCMMDEIDQAWIMSGKKKDNDIVRVWNGREYYFDAETVGLHDTFMSKLSRKGIPTLIRFINRDEYQMKRADGDLFRILKHPGYEESEKDKKEIQMSAFNLRTEEGFDHYCACLDFLISRYCDPDSPFGWSQIMDVGNEVNAQETWANCGPMRCEQFMEEYSVALRLAWLIGRQYHSDYRVDISVEHNFANTDNPDRTHFYPARECLLDLADITRRDGDFDWGVSAHPYPERLNYPDFYNDRFASFSLDTHKLTLKNMEVWPAFLSRPEMTYKGEPRRVLFDEQGFNTRPDAPYTEEQGAYGFVLAYLKFRKQPLIDMILIHRHIDLQDSDEYGLHLGLRYAGSGGYTDEAHLFPEPGRRKLICDAIAAMETPEEEKWIREARSFIGPSLFDHLLDPPPVDPGSMGPAKINGSIDRQ